MMVQLNRHVMFVECWECGVFTSFGPEHMCKILRLVFTQHGKCKVRNGNDRTEVKGREDGSVDKALAAQA